MTGLQKQVIEITNKIVKRVILKDKIWGNYCLDLIHEGMLEYGLATGNQDFNNYVFDILKKRKSTPDKIYKWESQPFCHINYKLYEVTKGKRYIKPFIDESIKYFESVKRSSDGLVLHHSPKVSSRDNVLIDSLQDYASRMAETGKITGDEKYYKECVEQYRLHRNVLCNKENGLWSNGRGWGKDINEICQGFWSRGHGWLIRGMVNSLCVLPKKSEYYTEMQEYLVELADALIKVQDQDGMWHKMLHFDFKNSPTETSGTALICANFLKAINNGFLIGAKYEESAILAFQGLQKYITEEGIIKNVDHRGGPLKSMEGYLNSV